MKINIMCSIRTLLFWIICLLFWTGNNVAQNPSTAAIGFVPDAEILVSREDGDCFDIDETCRERENRGECETNPTVMLVNCPITCQSCLPQESSDCIDQGDVDECFLGSQLGQCEDNPSYYLRFCSHSCREFISICKDQHNQDAQIETCSTPRSLTSPDFTCGVSVPFQRNKRSFNKWKRRFIKGHTSMALEGTVVHSKPVKSSRYGDLFKTFEKHHTVVDIIKTQAEKHHIEEEKKPIKEPEVVRKVFRKDLIAPLLIPPILCAIFCPFLLPETSEDIPRLPDIPVQFPPLISSPIHIQPLLPRFPVQSTPVQPAPSNIPPPSARSLVPNCETRGYLYLITQLQASLGHTGRSIPSSTFSLVDAINFCQNGGGSVPTLAAGIYISDYTSSKPSPPGWRGLSSPTSRVRRKGRNVEIPWRKPHSSVRQDGVIPIRLNTRIRQRPHTNENKQIFVRPHHLQQKPIYVKKQPQANQNRRTSNIQGIPIRADNRMVYFDQTPHLNIQPQMKKQIDIPIHSSKFPSHHISSYLSDTSDRKIPIINPHNSYTYVSLNRPNSNLGSLKQFNTLPLASNVPDEFDGIFYGEETEEAVVELESDFSEMTEFNDYIDIIADTGGNTVPQLVSGVTRENFYCGGILITNRHILTAAHCVLQKKKPNVIRLGEDDFSTSDDSQSFDYKIARIDAHSRYRFPEKYHDIAILTLEEPVRQSSVLKPYCIPTQRQNLEGELCTVSGWGVTPNSGVSEILQNLEVRVESLISCNNTYSSLGKFFTLHYPQGFTDSILCASPTQDQDACRGDSGGPLVLQDGNLQRNVGVVSAGYGCGSSKYPGIYSRVDSYINWIDEKVYGNCARSLFHE